MDSAKTWFVTGVSSGFGRALARAALDRGDTVVGTLRRESEMAEFEALAPGRSIAVRLDVTDREAVRTVVPAAFAAQGHVDVLVNNAGYALSGALEETSDDEADRQMETNLFGAAGVIRAALPALRAQGHGRIINISSQSGIIGYAGLSWYGASKFALEGLSEALRQELAPFGIHVTIVEPGGFRTKWAGASMTYAAHPLPAYARQYEGARKRFAAMDGRQPGDPERAAQALLALADAEKPPLRLVLGSDALAAITAKLAATQAEIDAWSELSCSSDIENAGA